VSDAARHPRVRTLNAKHTFTLQFDLRPDIAQVAEPEVTLLDRHVF
jgi:hypothetical protein